MVLVLKQEVTVVILLYLVSKFNNSLLFKKKKKSNLIQAYFNIVISFINNIKIQL
jgi:K+-transporting ATPase A subunit